MIAPAKFKFYAILDQDLIINYGGFPMKTLISSIVAVLVLMMSGLALADSVVIERTQTWKSVPVTIDESGHTYVVPSDVTVPDSDYYYSTPGYRCVTEERKFVGENGEVFHPAGSGSSIVCYKE